MKYYEYDNDGWLVGWYEAETPRPNSTQIPPLFPASQSRWVNGAWTINPTREQQRDVTEQAERTRVNQAITILKAYNPSTATAAEVRTTLGAAILLLKKTVHELRD